MTELESKKVRKIESEKVIERRKVKTFRDLLVWQKSMTIITGIYTLTKSFPVDETYGLASQMRRCSVSIPSNIAEGYGRNSNNEFIRFLHIALGSLYELQTQIEISMNLNYLDKSTFENLCGSTRELEKMLNSFTKKLIEKQVK